MIQKEIIVIGAGIGGLSAAIRLAHKGHHVTVLERNPYVGGKMATMLDGGYHFDTGPSVITMRPVIEDLFHAAGRSLADYISLVPLEPLTRYFFADRKRFDLSRNLPRTLDQIASLAPRDVEGYLAFLAQAAYLERVAAPLLTYGPPPKRADLLRFPFVDMLRVVRESQSTYDALIRRYIRSTHLQQILGAFALNVGASPYLAAGTVAAHAHARLIQGVWYPQGGMYSIALALERLARELGVEIATGVEVARLVFDESAGGKGKLPAVAGVVLRSGDTVPADIVVADVDVATVYEKFLPQTAPFQNRAAQLDRLEPSCSAFVMLLGVQGDFPALVHHNIIFANDRAREFDFIFNSKYPPDDPTIHITITAKTDISHAPPGGENWYVLVHVPPLNPEYNWDDYRKSYGGLVLNRLAERGFDVRDKLKVIRTLTPLDFQRMNGARRGAIYGVSFNDRNAPFKRPGNRAPDVRGLYFAGGSAHPGAGVPLVMLSGQIVTAMITEDL